MLRAFAVTCALASLAGCAYTEYLDGTAPIVDHKLPGLPVVYKDAENKSRLAYIKVHSGFGTASFTVKTREGGGIEEFTNNLDSTAAAQLAGNVIDKAWEAATKSAKVKSAEAAEKAIEDEMSKKAGAPDKEQIKRAVKAAIASIPD